MIGQLKINERLHDVTPNELLLGVGVSLKKIILKDNKHLKFALNTNQSI